MAATADITITVRRGPADTGSPAADVDVVLDWPPDDPASALARALRALVGAPGDATLSCGARRLPLDGRIVDWALRNGSVVRISGEPPAPPSAPPVASVTVLGGPDCGRRWELQPGEHVVGRDAGCDVRVDDPSVSRRHLSLTVGSDGQLAVTDLASANGTWLDDDRLGGAVAGAVTPGTHLRVGDSDLQVAARGPEPRPEAGDGDEHGEPAGPIEFPQRPARPVPARLPILPALVPLVAGVALAVAVRQWQFLAFTALAPLMLAAQAVSDRRTSRRDHRQRLIEHEAATGRARERLRREQTAERDARHRDAPPTGALLAALGEGRAPTPDRTAPAAPRPVRVGRGTLPSRLRVLGGPERLEVPDVPVTLTVGDGELVAIEGPSAARQALTRSIVLQLAAAEPASGLAVVALVPGGAGASWRWLRWLPHVRPTGGEKCRALLGMDPKQASARIDELNRAHRDRKVLLLVEATAALRRSAPLAELVSSAPAWLRVLWLDDDAAELPRRPDATLTLGRTTPSRLGVTGNDRPSLRDVVPDLIPPTVADDAARGLADRHRGATPKRLPSTVCWRDVAGLDLSDDAGAASALQRRWAAGPSLVVPIGRMHGGVVSIDLRRDGPHALVAGTTGSGKSELLRCLVAGLVAANRPDRLSLLLVDYKGGAAFAGCSGLPHVAGIVTDLDGATTQRALASLRAELRRRELVLADAGVSDLDDLTPTDRAPALPRLVIIVDEFATLIEELPQFVAGLVGIAARGRSLGVHLVLATQQPQGAVSADIRANTRLRICLAVTRDEDSRDLLDDVRAARISRATPGRGFLRVEAGECTELQVAQLSEGGRRTEQLRVCPLETLGDPPDEPVRTPGRSDLDILVRAAGCAARADGLPPAAPPWLPPLPAVVAWQPPRPGERDVGYGRVDLPDRQCQADLTLDAQTAAPMLVVGASRSGRTAAVRAMIASLATARSPDQLHLWAIDGGADLGCLERLPHCGGVVPAGDDERVERVLSHLATLTTRSQGRPPGLLLVIDGWEAFVAGAGSSDGGRLVERVIRLVADGPRGGLRVVISSDRGGLSGRLGSTIPHKLVLRLADPSDLTLAGVPLRELPGDPAPGRALLLPDRTVAQVALCPPELVGRSLPWQPPVTRPQRFDPLPDRVALPVSPGRRGSRLVLGVGGDHGITVDLDPAADGGTLLVTGPRGSGRSTTLRTLASQLTDRPVAIVTSHEVEAPLAPPTAVCLPADDESAALRRLDRMVEAHGGLPHLLVDDADLLGEGALSERLEAAARTARRSTRLFVAAGAAEALASVFRGPVAEARRSRVGILLHPGPHDGELFGVRLTRRATAGEPPGRGWLAVHGRLTRLQVGLPAVDPVSRPR